MVFYHWFIWFYSTGSYMVVAPKTIRPGLPYAVSVNILKSEDSKPVSVSLRIIDDANKTLVEKIQDVSSGDADLCTE